VYWRRRVHLIDVVLALAIDPQPDLALVFLALLRVFGARDLRLEAGRDDRGHDHEDDEQHQHHVDHRRDVDVRLDRNPAASD